MPQAKSKYSKHPPRIALVIVKSLSSLAECIRLENHKSEWSRSLPACDSEGRWCTLQKRCKPFCIFTLCERSSTFERDGEFNAVDALHLGSFFLLAQPTATAAIMGQTQKVNRSTGASNGLILLNGAPRKKIHLFKHKGSHTMSAKKWVD